MSAASQPEHEVTRLLRSAAAGDSVAYDQVFELVYEDLRRRARRVRRSRNATLNTTALVHEAYLHLAPAQGLDWEGRSHFLGVAARAMRQVVVAAARRRAADKRGGGVADVPLDAVAEAETLAAPAGSLAPSTILTLDGALQELEELSPRQARVVECRYFAGMSVEETAETLGVSTATVKREWRTARAFLARALG